MYSEQRKAEIIEIIEKDGSVGVNELAERFGISRETIRRDLGDLERQGVLRRTHGGAVQGTLSQAGEYPVDIRGIRHSAEKDDICRLAASFIQHDDTIFADNSSTLIYMPKYIPKDLRLTIITNSISFLLEASKIPRHNWLLICLGGIFKPGNLSVHGSAALKNAGEYFPNKTFFSCAGISPVNRVADTSIHEIEVKRMMIDRAQETFLLADSAKFDKAGQIFLCDFSSVGHIITDGAAKPPEYLYKSGVDIITAK